MKSRPEHHGRHQRVRPQQGAPALAGRLPHDPEAERWVLGAAVQEATAIQRAAEILTPGDFYSEANRRTFAAVLALSGRNEPVDLRTLTDELRQRGELEAVGGPAALAALIEDVPTPANVAYHAGIVRKHARRRNLAEACLRAAERACANGAVPVEDFETIVGDLEHALLSTADQVQQQERIPLSVGAEEFLAGKIEPVEWAVEKIWPAEASGIIGGPEKAGKSWLADELALSLATGTPFLGKHRVPRPRRVLRWEEEDSAVRTHRRDCQLLAGRHRPMPRSDLLRYLVGHGLKLDQREGMASLKEELEAYRPEVAIVGNLREIHGKDENRPEMAEVRDAFRALSRQYGCAFVVIHHFRKTQADQSKRGTQMLAGSGVWGAWVEAWMWVTPGETEDIAILEVGSKDAPGIGRLVVQRRDLTDREPLARDEEGKVVWPVVLAEIEPKSRAEQNREKVRQAGEELYGATGEPVTVEKLMEKVDLKQRTVEEHARTLVLEGAWQAVDLPGRLKGYVATPGKTAC